MVTTRLALPVVQMKPEYTVVVVGSGYGGAIAASRLARAGQDVCVLERGREFQPGEYPDTDWEAIREFQLDMPSGHLGSRTGLYDLRANEEINVFVGCGLGGTSLVNANVSIRPEPRVLEDPRWPAALRADMEGLAEGYRRAEDMLRPVPYPDGAPALKKLQAMERSAAGLGAPLIRPPINVTFQDGVNHVGVEQHACRLCGNCCSGCNYGAKNTVLMNYLPDARNHGAEIYTEVSVRRVEREGDRWLVHYQLLDSGRERFDAPTLFVAAHVVVLAAGTLGSTEILLRSRAAGLPVSDRLGRGFSGNGDVLGFAYNNDVEINGIGWGAAPPDGDPNVGPCITGLIDLRNQTDLEDGMVIEEGAIPGPVAALLPEVLALAAGALGRDTDAGDADEAHERGRARKSFLEGPYRGAVRNTQTFLVMAHDDSDGRMHLEEDRLRIDWPGVGDQPIFQKVNDQLDRAVEPLGGTYVKSPVWTDLMQRDLVTVHPLGGCGMGDDAQAGVVDDRGRVFAGGAGTDVHEGLYVWDGSIVPRSLGVNPLLTISALAERAAALLARDRGWPIDEEVGEAPPPPARTGLTLRFTERMHGYLSTKVTDDPDEGYRQGKVDGETFEFILTIRTDDLDEMIRDPDHGARIAGTVSAPALSPTAMTVSGGAFQLFAPTGVEGDREMRYRMLFRSEEGRTFHFEGLKRIHDDPGFDTWFDTTTLFVTVRDGGPDGPVVGSGILKIAPTDLARQLSTMDVEGADSVTGRLEALSRFGQLFGGTLFGVYGGIAKHAGRAQGTRDLDPDAPPRKKRPLQAPPPETYFFDTKDRVRLRLVRYRGGSKGPVVLAHGMAMSGRMFALDTIDTNLVEYLTAHGFDAWLLDWRASIDLPSAATPFTADHVALSDWPAAIRTVREKSGSDSVQAMVHCVASLTFFMSMLAGLEGVRSVVASQMATHMVLPKISRLRAALFAPGVLERLGVHSMTTYVEEHPDWSDRLWNRAASLLPLEEEEWCDNPVCRRLTLLYGLLYEHDQLNSQTHATLHEQFGVGNVRMFEHLALIGRRGHLVSADGQDGYLSRLDRLALPISFLHGAESEVFEPASTERTFELLREANGDGLYTRTVFPNRGHLDGLIGKDAYLDVYPVIRDHLEAT